MDVGIGRPLLDIAVWSPYQANLPGSRWPAVHYFPTGQAVFLRRSFQHQWLQRPSEVRPVAFRR